MTPRLPFLLLFCASVARGLDVNVTNNPSLCIQLPGYTNHLYGTFTNNLIITNSGTFGNYIDFKAEQGATFIGLWGGNYTDKTRDSKRSAAITTANSTTSDDFPVSYVIVDGFLVTTTNNGAGKQYSTNWCGIYVFPKSDVMVMNNTISNGYTRVYGDTCPGDIALSGIIMGNSDKSTNVFVHHNKVYSILNAIQLYYGNNTSNYQCYANGITNVNQAINFTGPATGGGNVYAASIKSNSISLGSDFDGSGAPGAGNFCPGNWHADAIFCNNGGSDATDPTNHNFNVSFNRCYSGGATVQSGMISFTPSNGKDGFPGLIIANNLCILESPNVVGTTTNLNNPIQCGIEHSYVVYNTINAYNGGVGITFIANCTVEGNLLFNLGYSMHYQTTDWITNNPATITSSNTVWEPYWPRLVTNNPANTNQWPAMFLGSSPEVWSLNVKTNGVVCDYNAYSSTNLGGEYGIQVEPLGSGISQKPGWGNNVYSWPSSWTNECYLQDVNSRTGLVTLVSYVPSVSSQVVFGTNLTSLGITTDINGNPRPSSGSWTVGAFEVNTNVFYILTLMPGRETSNRTNGEAVSISCTNSSLFNGWISTSGTLAPAGNCDTTFVMPGGNATVTASYTNGVAPVTRWLGTINAMNLNIGQ